MGPEEWDTTGQGLRECARGSDKEASGHAVTAQHGWFSCCQTPAPPLRPLLPLRMPQLPPQRGGRAFLLGSNGAWLITALPVVSTAGWHKSHWKCLNYIINLQAINFPSLRHRDLIDKPLLGFFFMLPWCLLLFSFQNGARIRPFGIKYVWLKSPQMDQNNLDQWKVFDVELNFTVYMCAWSVSSAMFK